MKPNIPLSLKIVAWLFIISGIMSAIEVILALSLGNININFGVLNIFAGIGLLKLSSGWRTYSLVMIWLAMIVVPVVTIVLLSAAGPLDLNFFGQKIGNASRFSALILIVPMYVLVIWQYRVLTRPDVKELFIKKEKPVSELEL